MDGCLDGSKNLQMIDKVIINLHIFEPLYLHSTSTVYDKSTFGHSKFSLDSSIFLIIMCDIEELEKIVVFVIKIYRDKVILS